MTRLADGSRSVGELQEREQASTDAQPLTVRCALCRWTYQGTAGEARERAAAHRARRHPELVGKRRGKHRRLRHSPGTASERAQASLVRAQAVEVFPHGTLNRYTTGCRCASCSSRWSAYHSEVSA